jgi:tungstate transport system substrate-binding protein
MKNKHFATLLCLATFTIAGCATATKENRVVRVAVIGGMMKTGLWPEIAQRFETESDYKVELAMSGNRELLAEAFREGKADLLTMHSGDVSTDLVADGYGRNMRPWTRNEFVIIGPRSDPAGIRGLRDGAVALERIAKAQAPFVDFQNSGTRELTTKLWKKAGIRPQGDWLLKDESDSSEEVMEFARKKQAYLMLGRIPVLLGIFAADGMEILAQGDPEMRRPFIVMEANPKKFPDTNIKGARALADYLLLPKTQGFLLQFGTNSPGGMPLFYPVILHGADSQ